ncbi:Y-family DNA polymerase [Paraburkholderia sp. BCC1885]|uniref:Y-family DNA polymerase n=1 Tax=Paraburkholderia sp. BCC1885 TaxID=2562669 RepID=UPI001642440A|nr:DNA polymerase Y family protein [Paraburkholderia sp. BCC1885]
MSLEIFRPQWLGESAHGCVVLEGDRVALLDRKAGAAGVRPGMRRGGVLTLVLDIELHERDMAKEDETLQEVAVALTRFSPDVAVAAEATVLMDISASLRLFGGVAVLCREVRRVVDTMGVGARITAAPTGSGAWLLARACTGRLLKLASLERRLSALWFGGCIDCRQHRARTSFSRSQGAPPRNTRGRPNCWWRGSAWKVCCARQPAPTADYRPETANRWVPLGDAVRTEPKSLHMPRPAWLLDKPVQLMIRRHRPFYGSPLRKVSPPERVEAGWHDGRLITPGTTSLFRRMTGRGTGLPGRRQQP